MTLDSLKFYIMTFGCKVNQYESEHIAELFAQDGAEQTDDLPQADVVVVNSCTVTEQADTKLRHFISRARRENPDCVLVLAGCWTQAKLESASSGLYDISSPLPARRGGERLNPYSLCDILVGSKGKNQIPQLVYEFMNRQPNTTDTANEVTLPKTPYSSLLTPHSFEPMINTAGRKTRAYMKIQDGCDMHCSYCIIPAARGHICSKPLNDVVKEAKLLIASGHKELILTGINLCCYGLDFHDGTRLIDAVEEVCSVEGDFRVRLGSLEPEMISDSDIERMARLEKLCPHFHLSLQSGCDRTLKAMHRHYTTEEYECLCEKLRTAFPKCAITADIMVGFPGETREDFEESLAFAEKIGFASAHIFPYSRRNGTPADKMDGQLDKHTKSQRAAEMAEVCKRSSLEYNRSFVGKTVNVLFEKETSPDFHHGHTAEYVEVKVPRTDGETWFRQLREVTITSADEKSCYG